MTLGIDPVGVVDRHNMTGSGPLVLAVMYTQDWRRSTSRRRGCTPTRNDPSRWCVALVSTESGNGHLAGFE